MFFLLAMVQLIIMIIIMMVMNNIILAQKQRPYFYCRSCLHAHTHLYNACTHVYCFTCLFVSSCHTKHTNIVLLSPSTRAKYNKHFHFNHRRPVCNTTSRLPAGSQGTASLQHFSSEKESIHLGCLFYDLSLPFITM